MKTKFLLGAVVVAVLAVFGVIGLQQASIMSKIQYSVARKMLDNQQMQGAAVVKLIDAAGKGVAICQSHVEAIAEFELMILQEKFGTASKKLLPKIQKLRDIDKIRAVASAIKSAESVDEIKELLR